MLPNPNHQEIVGIQYIRAIAACFVVISHADSILALPDAFGEQLFGGFLWNGAVGVDLFFVVSGFIITIVSLQAKNLAPRLDLYDYARKRFARIIPFLWLCVIVYALVRFLGTGKFEWGPYLTSLFLWPIGEVRPPVVWTLRHEALFYFIFAISFLGAKKRVYVLLLWCLSPIAYGLIADKLVFQSENIKELLEFLFNPCNLTFGCGVLLGLLYLKSGVFQSRWQPPAWMITGFMLAGCAALFYSFYSFGGFSSAPVNILATLIVFASLWLPASTALSARIGHILGDASYSIYLTHTLFLLIGVKAWIVLFGPQFLAASLILLTLASVIAGVGVHYLAERPLVKISQKVSSALVNRLRTRPAVAEIAK